MKYFISLSIILLFLSSCSKDKEEKQANKINAFGVSQDVSNVQFNYEVAGNFKEYTISYDLATAEVAGGEGEVFMTDKPEECSKSINELNLQFGNKYAFYIKGMYDGTKETDWYGPEYLDLDFLCETPYDLNITGSPGKILTWSVDNHSIQANKFQVRYVIQGAEVSTGKTIEVLNATETSDFQIQKNMTYDVYVRGFCGGTYQWSDWSESVSFHATESFNLCTKPEPLDISLITGPFSADGYDDVLVTWPDPEDGMGFEIDLLPTGMPLSYSGGAIFQETNEPVHYSGISFTKGTSYNFYVRAVCEDGSKTEWTIETLTYN